MKIGLEIHVALPTKSKLFCSCGMESDTPNTEICPICMGFPGSKPMLNEEAVRSALGIASALHCVVQTVGVARELLEVSAGGGTRFIAPGLRRPVRIVLADEVAWEL